MPLELKRGGTIVYRGHGLFFYGDVPRLDPEKATGSGSERPQFPWQFRCKDQPSRMQFERLLAQHLRTRFQLEAVRLVHFHTLAELKVAVERNKDRIWDVVGYIGHSNTNLPEIFPVLTLENHDRVETVSAEEFNQQVARLPGAPKQIAILGCDAAASGFAEAISRAFPRAVVGAGYDTNRVAVEVDDTGKNVRSVEITGEVISYRAGRALLDDNAIAVRVREAIRQAKEHGDAALAGANVTVTVSKGVVTLGGAVLDNSGSERALWLARRVAGVKEVDNRISVADPLDGLGGER